MKPLNKMTNDELWALVQSEAQKHGAKAVAGPGGSIELEAPQGYQFDAELHVLVTAPWDLDKERVVLFRALQDIRENGPRIKKCPDDCPCKEDAEKQ